LGSWREAKQTVKPGSAGRSRKVVKLEAAKPIDCSSVVTLSWALAGIQELKAEAEVLG
jgi:hypothetical protein